MADLIHFIQFCDGADLVHWKTTTFMTVASMLVDDSTCDKINADIVIT